MSTLYDIINDISKMQLSMKGNVSNVLHEEGVSLLKDVRAHSPVDTGTYRSSWLMSKNRFSSSNVISSVSLSNNTPWAYLMEFGSEKKVDPWNYPSKNRRDTGKLIYSGGKVWAGGLSPGHDKTVGGAAKKVLIENNSRLLQISNRIADAVVGGIK